MTRLVPCDSRATVEELGVEYALESVRPYEDTGSPELVRLNPNAKIPVLEDGELVLWESLAINLYLARKFGAPLWPDDERDRAVGRWCAHSCAAKFHWDGCRNLSLKFQ